MTNCFNAFVILVVASSWFHAAARHQGPPGAAHTIESASSGRGGSGAGNNFCRKLHSLGGGKKPLYFLVVARRDEDISWVSQLPIPSIVYSLEANATVDGVERIGPLTTPAAAFAQAIVDHYECLPPWTLFLSARGRTSFSGSTERGGFNARHSSSSSSSLSGVPGQEDGGGGSQGSSLLLELAARLESVGLHESAVEAYLKAGQPRKAIDCAVLLNQWSRAVELAEEFEFPQIEGLLAKKAAALKAKGDRLGAVELYRRANKSTDAAKMLATIAEEVVAQDSDPLRAKKLNVLAALEVERFRKAATAGIALSGHGDGDIAQTTAATLDTLMTMDDGAGDSRAASKVLDNAWRGAAAYHYFLLAQRQLYGQKMDDAMKTSIRLAEYEDILEPRAIYCLVALTAYHNKYFGICSRAFVKLETMPSLSEEQRDQVQTLAMHIFTKHSPLDPQPLAPPYLDCLENGTPYAACTASGRLISDGPNGGSLAVGGGVGAGGARAIACRTCRHSCLERMAASTIHCPLCHAPLM
mmetsp:Transcript_70623/g.121232  ORF Transcript_70623/g.121232 Transcript_70623/m.121232 type:complete len:527 (+) Transcript_70623:61-1641(+)